MTDLLPYIVILDWDGTIAGRVDYQSHRHSLQQYYKKHGIKLKSENTVPSAFNKDSNLIRKGFVRFIEELKAHFKNNIYFFIYTASERVWANKEIQWVEKTHDIKFQRPIFTRDDCVLVQGGYRKTIAKIFPRILRSLGKASLSKTQKEYILQKQFMIIDNNAVYTDMQQHLLLCPHYDFMVFENIIEDVPEPHLSHPQVGAYIQTLITNGIVCPFFGIQNDINKLMADKYKWFASKCRDIAIENKKYVNDAFFKKLKKLIIKNNVTTFSPSVIKQLQESCWKKDV